MKNITSIPDNIFKILSRNNNWILTKIQYDNKECDDELESALIFKAEVPSGLIINGKDSEFTATIRVDMGDQNYSWVISESVRIYDKDRNLIYNEEAKPTFEDRHYEFNERLDLVIDTILNDFVLANSNNELNELYNNVGVQNKAE